MRYVKILLSAFALISISLLLLPLRAQDLDDVTEGEEVQMEAAETGNLESLDESLDGVLSEEDSSVAEEASPVDETGSDEVLDLGDASFEAAEDEAAADATVEDAETAEDADVDMLAEEIVEEDAVSEDVATDEEAALGDEEALSVDEMSDESAAEEAVSDAGEIMDEASEELAVAEEDAAVDSEQAVEEGMTELSEEADMLSEEKGVAGDEAALDEGLTEEDILGEGVEETDSFVDESGAGEMPEVDLSSADDMEATDAPVDEAVEESVETSSEETVATEGSEGSLDEMIDDAMTTPAPTVVEERNVSADAMTGESVPVVAPIQRKTFSNDELIQQEETRRKAVEIHAQETLKQADKAYVAKDYAKAARLYEEALKYLGTRSATRSERDRAEKLSGKSNYRLALDLRKQGKLEDAEKAAQIALNRKYRAAGKLLSEIQKERSLGPTATKAEPKVEEPKAVWKREETKTEQKTVDQLLKEGKQFLAVENLDAASERFELVLKRDAYNSEAIRLLEKTAIKKYDRATAELNTTRQNMIVDVRQGWNPRDYAVGSVMAGPKTDGVSGGGTRVDTGSTSLAGDIEDRMKKIIIPEIDFRQFNINDVILFFQDASYENGGAGINFILHLGGGHGGGAAADDSGEFDAEDEDVESESDAVSAEDVPLITFRAKEISLYKALKTVTKVTGLRYSIEDGVVMIMRSDVTTDQLLTRLYDVLPTLITRVSELQSSVDAGGGDEYDDESIADGAISDPGRVELKPFFERMGVVWPAGSEISYIAAVGRLIVKNTEENLVEFEKILGLINILPSQIEIEARFVEVNQSEANELGFEWMLGDDWEIAEKTSSSGSLLGTAQYIQVEADDDGGLTKGLRFMEDMSLDAPADDIVTVSSVLTNPELQFVIHALQQKGNADLLSAPKVTTQSGLAARISVVTEYVYPTEFTVTPITGRNTDGSTVIVGGVVEPSSFNMREVGVVLDVTPEVTADGKMISLVMAPKVVTEPTWKNYGSTYTAPDGSTQQLTMEQPFFHTRSVETQVLIYNGATVVMGGMINEARTEAEDKVPFLGDIPILGRLFQSKYESTEKRNLLIFVTARLVDPSGKPLVTPDLQPLLPDVAKASDE